jgi:hypothetical protein
MGNVQVCKCNCNKKIEDQEIHIDIDEPLLSKIATNEIVCRNNNAVRLNDSDFNGDISPPISSRHSYTIKDNSADMHVEINDDNK